MRRGRRHAARGGALGRRVCRIGERGKRDCLTLLDVRDLLAELVHHRFQLEPDCGQRPIRSLGAQRVDLAVELLGEEIEALQRVAGDKVAKRIRYEPDPAMEAIAAGLPQRFVTDRAEALGFRADGLGLGPEASFDDIIRIHIEDDLGGTWVD